MPISRRFTDIHFWVMVYGLWVMGYGTAGTVNGRISKILDFD